MKEKLLHYLSELWILMQVIFMLSIPIILLWGLFYITLSGMGKNPINYVIYDKGSGNNMLVRSITEEDENCITFIYRTGSEGKFCWLYEIYPQK